MIHPLSRIVEFEKCEYLAQHIILSTTSIHLGAIIKNLKTVKEMWDKVKNNATTKSTLYLIDVEDQLASMRVTDSDDPTTHLTELKQHFKLMTKRYENLIQMGSMTSDTHFTTMIMWSLPLSYWSAIQTITAAERLGVTQGTSLKPKLFLADLIVFFIEEAQHHVIDSECTKAAKSALIALGKMTKKGSKLKHKSKTKSNEHCENCKKGGHTKADCWVKGGGKEGQGLRAKAKEKKKIKTGNSAALADSGDNSFTFFCTSTHTM